MATVTKAIIEAAQASQRKYDVPASVSIAQFGGESAWGTKLPPGSNNPFGVKARAGQAFVMAETTEVVGGQVKHVEQPFAKYASFAEAFDAHGKLFHDVSLYTPALVSWQHFHDADMFVGLMAPHYASAPNYATFIKSIMQSMNLYQYDHLPDLGQRTSVPASLQADAKATQAPETPAPAGASPAPVSGPPNATWSPVKVPHTVWTDLIERIDAIERALGLRT